MAEAGDQLTRPTDAVGRVLYEIAKWLAVAGCVLLFLAALMTTVSAFGRYLLSEPIRGTDELLAIGTGLAVFAMLPYCHIMRGNVIVDFITSGASPRVKLFLDLIGNLVFAGIAAILTWRMVYGGIDMYRYAEKSMTINFPRWTTFPISVLFLFFLFVVIVYSIGRNIAELRAGRYFDDK